VDVQADVFIPHAVMSLLKKRTLPMIDDIVGVLVKAMQCGHWIILDELNLAPSDVLEALNRVSIYC